MFVANILCLPKMKVGINIIIKQKGHNIFGDICKFFCFDDCYVISDEYFSRLF